MEVYRLVSAGTIEEIVYARQIYKQQQANIAYNASTERRYFKGVQQDKDRKGELFGLKNIFSFHGDHVVLQKIMNQTNVAEARVSAQMIEVDLEKAEEDDDLKYIKQEEGAGDSDGGLSQLATYIKSENPEELVNKSKANKPKADHAIQAILASAGVQYTHENSEVIGSSKVEAQLSRRAELVEDVDWEDLEGQSALFADEQANEAFIEGDQLSGFTPTFKPPQDVKHRQFCSMAKELGFDSVTEFALVVEQMTQEERRDALDSFYKKRMMRLLEELKKDEDRDEKKVNILKAEAGVLEDSKPKSEEDIKDAKVRTDVNAEVMVIEQIKSETVVKEQVKSDVKKEPLVAGQSAAIRTELINGVRPISSIFIYDDDEDDEL